MRFDRGARLGPYEVIEIIGSGGMGEVYRARDIDLKRDVALKVLPLTFAHDSDRLARLQREAELLASVNHPNIAQIYGLERDGGTVALAMELVEGLTLAERLAHSRIAVAEALRIAGQIADALEASHERGIVHRDLKPANIKLRHDGSVTVLDFGIAKALNTRMALAAPNAGNAGAVTEIGSVLGTTAYMSPEQARGRPVDRRSDIWAFGCVLYEMLAGQPAFLGDDDAGTLGRVLQGSANWSALPSDVPPPVRRTLELCFEKDARKRIADIGDVKLALAGEFALGASPPATWRRVLPFGLALVAGLLLASVYFVAVREPTIAMSPPQARLNLDLRLPESAVGLALSPDGRHLAYNAARDGVRQIWLRPLDSPDARAVPGTVNGTGAFWSPDSRFLAFYKDNKLMKVAVPAGAPEVVADAGRVASSGTWSGEGTILFADAKYDIGRVSADGGIVSPATTPHVGDDICPPSFPHQTTPRMLPDDERFVYFDHDCPPLRVAIYIDSLESPKRVHVTDVANPPVRPDGAAGLRAVAQNIEYADGYLLWLLSESLMAQRFDARSAALHGDAISIAKNVGEFSVSKNGVLVYREPTLIQRQSNSSQQRKLVRYARGGQRLGEVPAPPFQRLHRLSPDGRRIAVTAPGAQMDIFGAADDVWTIDLATGATVQLTSDPADDALPIWSPDGAYIAFDSGRGAVGNRPSRIYRRAANGAGMDELLFAAEIDEFAAPLDWSSDGKHLIFMRGKYASFRDKSDIWVLPLTGDATAFALLDSPSRKRGARLSPNGRWIAYSVREPLGRDEVVVRPFPDVREGSWPISTGGGYEPRWRGDGDELYYLGSDGALTVVDTRTDGKTFERGEPKKLFSTGLTITGDESPPDTFYDVSADGQSFFVAEPVSGPSAPATPSEITVHVIVNWSEGLASR